MAHAYVQTETNFSLRSTSGFGTAASEASSCGPARGAAPPTDKVCAGRTIRTVGFQAGTIVTLCLSCPGHLGLAVSVSASLQLRIIHGSHGSAKKEGLLSKTSGGHDPEASPDQTPGHG